MSEISTSEISVTSSGTSRYCACGTKIIRRTSWTDLNLGRRFDACDKNWNSRRGMHFFEWVDNETCPRGKQVVPGLLRRLRAMEEEGRAKEEQLRSVEAKKKDLQQKLKEMVQENKVLEWGHGQRQLIMWVSLILSWGLFITFVMNGKF
ncbi:uncharacterized protein At4g04775 [Prunus avium]|uniref:Uncharacterized protein At4g04775 n=1 Tax=Prunus avium TaxID=42229 RepID=A0A6P5TDB0_PRUAV|nr:uncharacterized protein At4g04775 [Prunus avium]